MRHAAHGGATLTFDSGRPAARRRAVPASRVGLAAIVILAAAVVGCGGPVPTAGLATGAAGTTAPPASTSGISAADATARLRALLVVLAPRYRFDTTVRVGDTVATTVVGRVADGASELEVTAAGSTVAYRAVPPRAWARTKGGAWQELDTKAPSGNPLGALQSPAAVEVLGVGEAGLRLIASYPAATLGLAGSDLVRVELLVSPDGTLKAIYTAPTSGASAVSETTYRSDPGGAPITAPATTAP
jgi:hypothetical protein